MLLAPCLQVCPRWNLLPRASVASGAFEELFIDPSSMKFFHSHGQETRAKYIDQLCLLSCLEWVSSAEQRGPQGKSSLCLQRIDRTSDHCQGVASLCVQRIDRTSDHCQRVAMCTNTFTSCTSQPNRHRTSSPVTWPCSGLRNQCWQLLPTRASPRASRDGQDIKTTFDFSRMHLKRRSVVLAEEATLHVQNRIVLGEEDESAAAPYSSSVNAQWTSSWPCASSMAKDPKVKRACWLRPAQSKETLSWWHVGQRRHIKVWCSICCHYWPAHRKTHGPDIARISRIDSYSLLLCSLAGTSRLYTYSPCSCVHKSRFAGDLQSVWLLCLVQHITSKTLSVRPSLHTWLKKNWQSSSWVTTVACTRLGFLAGVSGCFR